MTLAALDGASTLGMSPWGDGTYQLYNQADGPKYLLDVYEQGTGAGTWLYLSTNTSKERKNIQWTFKAFPASSVINDQAWSTFPTPTASSQTSSTSPDASATASATSNGSSQSSSGLSTGAEAGIGVAVAVAVLGLFFGALLLLRRRRKARQPASQPAPLFDGKTSVDEVRELDGASRAELP